MVLLGVAKEVLIEDVFLMASQEIERRSVPIIYRNLLFLKEDRRRLYQYQYCPQGYNQNFQTLQALRSQGRHEYGSSGPRSSSSRPG
ncbi:hypothetical protein PanWU01x14_292220 [Parasponia andersonii]|uniref:Uncharacterized protein n=1 Tax=Parasponia andersonii TaxID=3476 RepID=A0A2P5AX67_PARAD|nr:hypothetical protein PanWU01x14_292220 [Parasponia andersonii]